MDDAPVFEDVQREVLASIPRGAVLIGHDICHDLKVLQMATARSATWTVWVLPFLGFGFLGFGFAELAF